jgi:HEAT repeat protein
VLWIALGSAVAVVAAAIGVFALTSVGGPSSPQELIDTLLASSERGDRLETADTLAGLLDPDVVSELAELADDQAAAADGLALVRDSLIALLEEPAAAQDPGRREMILRSLSVVDDESAAAAMVASLLGDDDPGVRDVAADSLGRMTSGAPAVVDDLVTSRKDLGAADDELAADLERALVAIGAPVVPELVGLIDDDETAWAFDVVVAVGSPAVRALGREVPASLETELAVAEALRQIEVAEPGAASSVWPRVVRALITELDSAAARARRAQTGLALIGAPAVDQLVQAARTTPSLLLRFASAEGTLMEMASNDVAAVASLEEALTDRDHELITDLIFFFIALGKPGSEGAVLAAVERHGDPFARGIEESLVFFAVLRSDNPRLEQGARDYAARHGFTIAGDCVVRRGGTEVEISPCSFGTWGASGAYGG